jgi:hypothetical protein
MNFEILSPETDALQNCPNTAIQKIQKKRGRKQSNIATSDLENKVMMKQHHFNYSEEFATMLASFATIHLEDDNNTFKTAWKEWVETHSSIMQSEIQKMKDEGYSGSVEDKMYFSARYYYRKRAIKEQNLLVETTDDDKSRKKYESIEKPLLNKMREHILSQIYLQDNCSMVDGEIVSNMTPSKSFKHYCLENVCLSEDSILKKHYKNLYWRISKQIPKK